MVGCAYFLTWLISNLEMLIYVHLELSSPSLFGHASGLRSICTCRPRKNVLNQKSIGISDLGGRFDV